MRRLGNVMLAFALWGILCSPAAACVAFDEIKKAQGQHFAEVVTFDGGRESEIAAQIFNSFPPESDMAINFVALATLKSGGGLMFVGKYQAVCAHVSFNPRDWEAVLRSIRGVGI